MKGYRFDFTGISGTQHIKFMKGINKEDVVNQFCNTYKVDITKPINYKELGDCIDVTKEIYDFISITLDKKLHKAVSDLPYNDIPERITTDEFKKKNQEYGKFVRNLLKELARTLKNKRIELGIDDLKDKDRSYDEYVMSGRVGIDLKNWISEDPKYTEFWNNKLILGCDCAFVREDILKKIRYGVIKLEDVKNILNVVQIPSGDDYITIEEATK